MNQKTKWKSYTDLERNNTLGMITHWIVVVIMLLYLLQKLMMGRVGISYYLICAIVGLFSPLAEVYFYKKDKETPMVKHFLGYGYAVFYTIVLFTSQDSLVFLFVVPLLLIITIYNDTKYTIKINTGTIIESLLVTIIGAKTGKYGYIDSTNAILQNVTMILIGVFSYMAAKSINDNMNMKLSKIEQMVEKTEDSMEKIYQDMENLTYASKMTGITMRQVSAISENTVATVEEQLNATSVIEEQANTVNESSKQIRASLKENLKNISDGNSKVQELFSKVDASAETGEEALRKLDVLQESMRKMNSITKIIDDISFQTNILALNANVEAARAGEAGKSFAVVASEVAAMSLKTKDSTENIASLIGETMDSLDEVASITKKMIDEIINERTTADETRQSFEKIQNNTLGVSKELEELAGHISDLASANHGIIDAINTISQISMEASSKSKEAMDAEVENTELIRDVTGKMEGLVEALK